MSKTENKIEFGKGNTISNSPITQGSDKTEVNIKSKNKLSPTRDQSDEKMFHQTAVGQISITVIGGLIIAGILALFK